MQAQRSFVSIVLLGLGGQQRPGIILRSQFGHESTRLKSIGGGRGLLWNRLVWMAEVVAVTASTSVFPFVCLLQIMKRNLAAAARSQDFDVGVRSTEAASRSMAQ